MSDSLRPLISSFLLVLTATTLFSVGCSSHVARSSVQPVILLDHWFNRESKINDDGKSEYWHYTWEDTSNGGYSQLRDLFRKNGFDTRTLDTAPHPAVLQQADLYFIVDPDTEKESARPHAVSVDDIRAIREWVRAGGILILFGNDRGNAEFVHFNQLASEFGIRFNEDKINTVPGPDFEPGAVYTPAGHAIFGEPKKLYLKEFSSISVSGNARSLLEHRGHTVMAGSEVGKGYVFALGDPWIYNEYMSHKYLPAGFQNEEGASAWVQWLKRKQQQIRNKPKY